MRDEQDYFQRLIELMELLRGPNGCPWDREQTRESLKPMLIEEAYEVLQALDGDNAQNLCEELGDLLFQVIFHSCIAKENGEFDAHQVCREVYRKMVARHPHVFGEESYSDSRELLRNWEDIKAAEKAKSGRPHTRKSLMDGIPERLPALYQAHQACAKAARVGFDWPRVEGIRDQFLTEFEELREAMQEGDQSRMKEKVGDLLFTALNIARFLQMDPETALQRATQRFSKRFRAMECHFAAQGQALKEIEVEEMRRFWSLMPAREENGGGPGPAKGGANGG
ncbi:MAG: nucleoside triphosphate pyrophosphohydrolase [Acidobacteriota bacterium]